MSLWVGWNRPDSDERLCSWRWQVTSSGPSAGLPRFVPNGLRVNGVLVLTAEALSNAEASAAPAGAALTLRVGRLTPRAFPSPPEAVQAATAMAPTVPMNLPFPVWGLPNDSQDGFTMRFCVHRATAGVGRSPAPGESVRVSLPMPASQQRARLQRPGDLARDAAPGRC